MPALSKGFFEGHDNLNALHQADGKTNGSSRPADECPFQRPFPVGFNECPTFRPQPFNPMDMSDRPLAPMLTCSHLMTRTLPNGKVGWYAACRIGDEAARRTLAGVPVN
jgi:hypothetical protein